MSCTVCERGRLVYVRNVGSSTRNESLAKFRCDDINCFDDERLQAEPPESNPQLM